MNLMMPLARILRDQRPGLPTTQNKKIHQTFSPIRTLGSRVIFCIPS
jgi:hypothetical protein